MSKSSGSGSSTVIPTLSPEQRARVAAENEFFTKTIVPTYQQITGKATDIYNQNAPGMLNAEQNLAKIAGQAGQTFGETGESALRTGVAGLQNLFSPDYEKNQIMAALAPGQAQYTQNVANQRAGFGGMGQLGSARQALADRQLAGATQGAQMATAANIQQQIAGQRLQAANQLAGIGQGNLGSAINAAGQVVNAAGMPMGDYGRYATIAYGTPAASYSNIGPYGTNTNTSNQNLSVGFKGISF
jgi:hypothetical protein